MVWKWHNDFHLKKILPASTYPEIISQKPKNLRKKSTDQLINLKKINTQKAP